VVVNKTVSLTGENRDTTIIDGGGVGNAVDVLANNVTITGFTVRGSGGLTASGFGSGIYLFCSDNAEIRGNNIVSNYCGIYLKQSNNVVISENAILFQSNPGVYLVDSRGIIVKKNNMTNNRVGIYIAGSEDSIVSENNITNNERSGIESVGFRSYNNSFIRNVITGNMRGIVLVTADRNILDGNIVTNNMVGIELRNSEGIILRNNNMTSNRENFHVSGAWYVLEHFIHDIDTSNTVNGKPMYYLVNQHNLTVPTDAGYVAVVNSTLVTMRGLILTSNGEGVLLFNVTKSLIENVTLSDNGFGIIMYNSNNNTIRRNHVINNFKAVVIVLSGNNTIYHNNFIDNDGPAWNPELDSNIWDDGYPSGGNYWSDYNGTDLYSGPYQNETGSDGIGDTPYVIDENNVDRYPLMSPWTPTPPAITASVDIHPEALNLISKGKWIATYIEFPEGHNVTDINVSTILLNDTVSAELSPSAIGDYDEDSIPDLMVKFNRSEIIAYILSKGVNYGNVTLTLSGKLTDGLPFEGSCIIAVSDLAGDVNCDGVVDIYDIGGACISYDSEEGESSWNPNANYAPPYNKIDIYDIVTIAYHYGETYP